MPMGTSNLRTSSLYHMLTKIIFFIALFTIIPFFSYALAEFTFSEIGNKEELKLNGNEIFATETGFLIFAKDKTGECIITKTDTVDIRETQLIK